MKLRDRKIHALEQLRGQSMETFAQPVSVEVHESDICDGLLITIEKHKTLDLVAELQQKLVINSPVATEQVRNQVAADKQLDADNDAQQPITHKVR
jgi:hypothetical protein